MTHLDFTFTHQPLKVSATLSECTSLWLVLPNQLSNPDPQAVRSIPPNPFWPTHACTSVAVYLMVHLEYSGFSWTHPYLPL
jgi:hypothetical protein